jgi:hypothetical protein
MKHYKKKPKTTEDICINKIAMGIQSIKNGNRDVDSIGSDLEFFFNKLSEVNKLMYEDLYLEYCIARLKAEECIKGTASKGGC